MNKINNKKSSSNLKNASNNRTKSFTSKKEKLDESTSTNSSNDTSKMDSDREEGEESSSNSDNENGQQKSNRKIEGGSGAEDGELDSDESYSTNPAKKVKQDSNGESIETKIKKLNKLIEKFKSEFKNCEHKLSKIERAIKKALAEGNKLGVKKCEKYKVKYEAKLSQIKKKLKLCNFKLNELKSNKQNETNQKTDNSKADQDVKQSNGTSNGKSQSESTQNAVQTTKSTTTTAPVIKLPFPVLNDKRDKTIILGTLETKFRELVQKLQVNRKNIDNLTDQIRSIPHISSNANLLEKNHRQLEKLKQLDQLYESQQDKLQKQIEYIKLSLHIESLTNRPNQGIIMNNIPYIQQLTNQLNEMYMYMKNENKIYLKKHHQKISGDGESSLLSTSQVNNSSFTNLDPQQESTMNRIRSLYDTVNHALASLLANIAASAHASAAMYAYNMSYYQYYQQLQNKDDTSENLVPPKPPVPIKEEIERASSAFAKFKSKISSFFTISQEIEMTKKQNNSKMNRSDSVNNSSVKKLIADYSDDSDYDEENKVMANGEHKKDEEENDEIKLLKLVNNLKKSNEIRKNKINGTHKFFDDKSTEQVNEEKNDDDNDDDDFQDIEVLTTSEIKSGLYDNRNYLFPSVKSCYFPMMSTLNFNENVGQQLNNVQIAVEKSSNAFTLLGPTPNNNIRRRVKLSDILYGKNL